MKFINLPSEHDIFGRYEELYYGDPDTVCLRHVKADGRTHFYTSHVSIEHACEFMMKNPNLDVCDDFFGNNFPFLCVSAISEKTPFDRIHSTVTITGLRVYRDRKVTVLQSISDCDVYHRYTNLNKKNEVWTEFYTKSEKKGLYLSRCFAGLCCATKTHDEIVSRLEAAEVMNS